MKIKSIKFKTVKSTNDEAIKLIKKNSSQPTLIISEKQLKGRGRMGKKWISLKGNLFLSIFFEMRQNRIHLNQYTKLNAYLFKKILSKFIMKKIKIKWPNDLLIEQKKVCGILQEIIDHKKKKFMIVGVGINTLNSPINVGLKTTSLSNYSKKKVDNNKILKDIKKTYEKFIKQTESYNYLNLRKKIK